MTFPCPGCGETYQPHWRDPNGTNLCRTCAAERRGDCQFGDHPQLLNRHPCSYGTEEPGTPCRYCGHSVPLDGSPCSTCWKSFEDMSLADIKAVLAADGTFSVGGLGRDTG